MIIEISSIYAIYTVNKECDITIRLHAARNSLTFIWAHIYNVCVW